MASLPVVLARPEERQLSMRLIRDANHYREVVLGVIRKAKVSIWIATANLKDVHVEASVGTRARANGRYVSLFDELESMAASGVEVRILHASPPSRVLSARLAKSKKPGSVERRMCPRVHLKLIAVDGGQLYLGSANFTGAGLGAKADSRRNFETGILTGDDVLLDEMQGVFDRIWRGAECAGCGLRRQCPGPLDQLGTKSKRSSSSSRA